MRYVSQLFQPVITIPKNAKIKNTEITCKSQKLLLECGLIRPTSAGLFALLPLARRALDKLEALATTYIERAGAQRVSLPAITAAGLWEKTGRLGAVEQMTVDDRHGKKFILSPTHEEAIADLLADVGPISYKQLPLLLYQVGLKYRDEARPKHGLLRAREFLMLDAYGGHSGAECAARGYRAVAEQAGRLFQRLNLPVYRVEAPAGDMGGSVSHEWQLPAEAGEDRLAICPSCSHAALASHATTCHKCGKGMDTVNSIEVGHTFILGPKYSVPLGAHLVPPSGPSQPLLMSCYGIGLTRLLAASLEALSSETALRWPAAIAPFSVVVIGPKEGSKEWVTAYPACVERVCEAASGALPGDVLVDDHHRLTVGKRLLAAQRMGYPTIIVCGKSTLESPPRYEVHRCSAAGDTVQLLTMEELVELLAAITRRDREKHLQLLEIKS